MSDSDGNVSSDDNVFHSKSKTPDDATMRDELGLVLNQDVFADDFSSNLSPEHSTKIPSEDDDGEPPPVVRIPAVASRLLKKRGKPARRLTVRQMAELEHPISTLESPAWAMTPSDTVVLGTSTSTVGTSCRYGSFASADSDMEAALSSLERNHFHSRGASNVSSIESGRSASFTVPDTPTSKFLPQGVYMQGNMQKLQTRKARSLLQTFTGLDSVKRKRKHFRLRVVEASDIRLEYTEPAGDRVTKERKWTVVHLREDMQVCLPAIRDYMNSKIVHELMVSGHLCPRDLDNANTKYAFQLLQCGGTKPRITDIDGTCGEIVLDLACVDAKSLNAWIKAIHHALRSLALSSHRREMARVRSSISESRKPSPATTSLLRKRNSSSFSAADFAKTIKLVVASKTPSVSTSSGWEGLLDSNAATETKNATKRSTDAIHLGADGAKYVSSSPSKKDEIITSEIAMEDLEPIVSAKKNDSCRALLLGSGASGGASLYRHRKSGVLYAVKVVSLIGKSNRFQVIQELSALTHRRNDASSSGGQSPCIVRLFGYRIESNEVKLILEFMDFAGLDRIVKTGSRVPERVVAGMAWQIIHGLIYMKYEKQMMHRDIKPANILWNLKGEVKISDFGIARKMTEDLVASTFIGTHLYMSPERYDPPYSYPADIYSMAIVLCELVSAVHPLVGIEMGQNRSGKRKMNAFQIHKSIIAAMGKSSIELPMLDAAGVSPQMKALLSKCLLQDPSHRPNVKDLRRHPWFEMHRIDSLDSAVSAVRKFALTYHKYEALSKTLNKRFQAAKSKIVADDGGDPDSTLSELRKRHDAKLRDCDFCPVSPLGESTRASDEASPELDL